MVALFDKLSVQNSNTLVSGIPKLIEEKMGESLTVLLDLLFGDPVTKSATDTDYSKEIALIQKEKCLLAEQIGNVINRSAEALSARCCAIIIKKSMDYTVRIHENVNKEISAIFVDNIKIIHELIESAYEEVHKQACISGSTHANTEQMLSRLLIMKQYVLNEMFSEITRKRLLKDIIEAVNNINNYERYIRTSITDEIKRILTTRTHVGEKKERTIMNYGLNGPVGLSRCTDRDYLCSSIQNAIIAFEPRLRNVKVTMYPSNGSDDQAQISISGTIAGIEKEEHIHFAIKDGTIATYK
jgi:type VI secretion system lysozyme-like protein